MEVMQVLHMNKGKGEASYAQNSILQRKILSLTYPILKEAVQDHLKENVFMDSVKIADLGCSSGPNTLTFISNIIDVVHATTREMGRSMPELMVSLNDLPGNDFNNVFESLPAFCKKLEKMKGNDLQGCYISGVPGSFYKRLFPRLSQNFIHSSTSLHWLSQVPPDLDKNATTHLNKGKIYISKSSPVCVWKAYLLQFQNDFSSFLKARSQEIIPGGRMVLSFIGRCTSDPSSEESCYHWELLSRALMSMASEGLTQEEKIDSFNFPYYIASVDELKIEIERDGSFIINRMETFEVEWNECCKSYGDENNTIGRRVSESMRAISESLLESHFGSDIMDELFRRYSHLIDEHNLNSSIKPHWIDMVVSLTRKAERKKEREIKIDRWSSG